MAAKYAAGTSVPVQRSLMELQEVANRFGARRFGYAVDVDGSPRLNPAFVEWVQGLPEGWVTGVEGVSRSAALKMLGNGVVPQQALLALDLIDVSANNETLA